MAAQLKVRRAPAPLAIAIGAEVMHKGRRGRITHLTSLDEVLVCDHETGAVAPARISELKPFVAKGAATRPQRERRDIKDDDFTAAEAKLGHIRPLLRKAWRTRADVQAVADKLSVHVGTVYEWIRRFEETGRTAALARERRADRGSTKLAPAIEAIVQRAIDTVYRTNRRLPLSEVRKEVSAKCRAAKVKQPHDNTLRNRIALRTRRNLMEAREGAKAVRETLDPIKAAFPGADHPLAVIQIDHTPADVIIVDDEFRRPIGRPWITVAIDVDTRMIVGISVSLDPPSALAVGICLSMVLLPKETYLKQLRVPGTWPIWGRPGKVHADNAREFKGKMIRGSCKEYGIDLEWRPAKTPHYGGHIERMCGTLNTEIRTLPGTTFNDRKKRQNYDSEKQAAMTLDEFEAWLIDLIVNQYHRRKHSVLGMSPLAKLEQGVLGTADRPGIGIAPRPQDETRVRLDWLPFVERTIQDYGVLVDGIHYYNPVLRYWIGARDPKDKKRSRLFLFRYDFRATSPIWFFDPKLEQYFPIHYRDLSRPVMTRWELRAARKAAGVSGKHAEDERLIFEAYERNRRREETAIAKTKAARRAKARRVSGQKRIVQPLAVRAPLVARGRKGAARKVLPFDDA
jgi:putative transposase